MKVIRTISPFLISFLLHILLLLLFLFFAFSPHDFKSPLTKKHLITDEPIILTTLTPSRGLLHQPMNQQTQTPSPHMSLSTQAQQAPQPMTQKAETKSARQEIEQSSEKTESNAVPAGLTKLTELQQDNKPAKALNKASENKETTKPAQERVIQRPRRRNLLALTGAFIKDQLHQEGNSILERNGVRKNPTLEELKYLSYQQKVDEQLMTSWRMVSGHHPRRESPHAPCSGAAAINFEIEQDGSLAFVRLVQSSGSREFDRLVVEAIKHAAPFPPIPARLGIKRYRPIGGRYNVRW